jgi:hypothetical protein
MRLGDNTDATDDQMKEEIGRIFAGFASVLIVETRVKHADECNED